VKSYTQNWSRFVQRESSSQALWMLSIHFHTTARQGSLQHTSEKVTIRVFSVLLFTSQVQAAKVYKARLVATAYATYVKPCTAKSCTFYTGRKHEAVVQNMTQTAVA